MPLLISLDVWNTLITFNREIRAPRTALLARLLGVSPEQADAAYQHFKKTADLQAEAGICWSQEVLYRSLIERVESSSGVEWEDLRDAVQENFRKFPPYIHSELVTVLARLHERGHEFAIASNNNFISGATIHACVLAHLETNFTFRFQLYSSEAGCAKPGSEFLRQFGSRCEAIGVPWQDVVHVGDNPVCDDFSPRDVDGTVQSFVRESLLVNDPAHCLDVLKARFL
ncbi:MAG: Caulobacter phage CcrColossus [Fibrobacterota bacterium]|jgi:FMN phosphatase YigB (HAD superfamily)